jgi:ribosomal-protein-alanine N-acetyltransferase
VRNIDEIRTERLILGRISSRDIEAVSSLYTDPSVMATLGGTRTAAQTQAAVLGLSEHWEQHGFGPWVAREAASDRFVGMGGLRIVNIKGISETEIGYALMPEFWGQGLATELARTSAYIGFAILDFPSLVSFTLPTNLPSQRVMKKVGFSFERDFTYKGFSQVLYRLTEATWRGSLANSR